MPVIRAQSSIAYGSGLPRDVSQNNWHFLVTGAPSDTLIGDMSVALTAFYNGIATYLNGAILSPTRTTKFYNLSDPVPRAPIGLRTTTHTWGTAAGVPEECCIVLSFMGDPTSGLNQRRRRGRVYLGPLTGTSGEPNNGRHRVTLIARNAIAAAGQTFLNASVAATGWDWVVYSPTAAAAGGGEEAWAIPVQQGFVDDGFDTQRRRGPRAQVRSTFT